MTDLGLLQKDFTTKSVAPHYALAAWWGALPL